MSPHRLSGASIANIVKAHAQRLGLDPARFSRPFLACWLCDVGRCLSGAGLATDEVPSNAAATTQVSGKESLWFELVTAALYHRDRLTWFIALHRGSMFANAFLGTAAVATLLQQQRWLIVAASLLLAFVSAASLAFDFAGNARKHEDRRRTYHDLAAQLEESADDESAVRLLRVSR